LPYAPAIIPLKGWHTDFAYAGIPEGYTHDIINMFPADTYRRRVRLGTRPGFNRMFDTTTAVQCIIRGIAYNGTPPTLKDRIYYVSNGRIYYLDIGTTTTQPVLESGTGTALALSTTANVEAVQRGKYIYFVDGLNYRRVDISASTPVWTDWTGPSTVVNNIGGTDYRASLIALYGSRLVLAGVKGIENIWFMSDVVNADDWTPSTTIGDAIAGNTGTIGSPGDEIVALIPFGQTGLIFAGQRTLTYLTSDPATDDRAALVQMSRNIGIVGPRAWSNGPEKSVYLMAQEGLYRIAPNDFNVDRGSLLSLNRLDSFFNQVRWENMETVLFYDIERRGLMCWMNDNLLPSNSTHIFYSDQTDGFFPFKMVDPRFRGAKSAAQFVTEDGRNQVAVYGSRQGMLGFFDQKITCAMDGYVASGYDQNLTPGSGDRPSLRIPTRVSMGPILNSQPNLVMIKEVQVELGSDVYTPNTNVKADADLPVVTLRTADTAQVAIGTTINTVQVLSESDVVYEGGDASTTVWSPTFDNGNNGASFTDYVSGEFAKSVIDVYTVQETFTAEADRVYRDSINRYEIVRDWGTTGNLRWVIRFVAPPEPGGPQVIYLQRTVDSQTNITDPTLASYDHIVTDNDTTVLDTDTSSRVRVTQEGFSDATVTELGEIEEGVNNRLRCRVRGNAAFLRISSLGYPFAMERVGIDANPLGPRRGVVDPT
jgi:hypothetical protein